MNKHELKIRAVAAMVAGLALLISHSASASGCPQRPPPPPTEDYQGFKGRVFEQGALSMPYRLLIPPNYDPNTAYPLVLYMHHAGLSGDSGSNETGLDNCVQLTEEIGSGGYGGVFAHEAVDENDNSFVTQEKYPHFLVAPHAESPMYGWGGGIEGSATAPPPDNRPLIYGILDEVKAEFNIDERRLYITGISMGCYGTWDIIMRDPTTFAAASPQSCRGDPDTDLLADLIDMPIWSMCGTEDSYFAGAQAMADGMDEVGANNFIFTPFEGVGHSIHNLGYDYPGFIDWMFAQALPEPEMPDDGMGGMAGVGGMPSSAAGDTGQAGTGGAAGAIAAGGAVGVAGDAALGGSTAGTTGASSGDDAGCGCRTSRQLPAGAPLGGLILLVSLGLCRRREGA